MNKTLLIIAILALCLTDLALSAGYRGSRSRNSYNNRNRSSSRNNYSSSDSSSDDSSDSTSNPTNDSTSDSATDPTSDAVSDSKSDLASDSASDSTSDSSSSSSTDSSFANTCVEAHTTVRSAVGVAALVWDDTIAALAQTYAETLAAASTTGALKHSGSGYGENLASAYGSSNTIAKMINGWAEEKQYFISGCTYPACTTGGVVGHYTQMVWEKSTQLGCGYAMDSANKWGYLVCRYYVHGNISGEKVYS